METFTPATQITNLYYSSIHSETVVSILKPSENLDIFLTLSIDKKVMIWDTTYKLPDNGLCDDAAPTKLILLKKNNKLLVPKWNNYFAIYEVSSLKGDMFLPLYYYGHSSWVLHAVELDNKDKFATCSRDKTIKIWNFITNDCEITLDGHTDIVNYLIPLENNGLLSCSSDGTIKEWDTVSYKCLNSITDGTLPVFQIEKLDNDIIISRSESNTLNIWSYKTSLLKQKFSSHKTNVICLKILMDKKFASGSYDHTIKIYDYSKDEYKEEGTLEGHTFTVYCIEQMKNSNIISGSGDFSIKLWDIKTFTCLATVTEHHNYVVSLCIIDEDQFASGSYDCRVIVWKVSN